MTEQEEHLIELAELMTMMSQRIRALEAVVLSLKAEMEATREPKH